MPMNAGRSGCWCSILLVCVGHLSGCEEARGSGGGLPLRDVL